MSETLDTNRATNAPEKGTKCRRTEELISFDYPAPNTVTIPGKLNDAGILVGEYHVAPEVFGIQVHAFLKDGSQLTDLDLPGTDGTAPWSINNAGVIVGYYLFGGQRRGFVRSGNQWSSFDVPRR